GHEAALTQFAGEPDDQWPILIDESGGLLPCRAERGWIRTQRERIVLVAQGGYTVRIDLARRDIACGDDRQPVAQRNSVSLHASATVETSGFDRVDAATEYVADDNVRGFMRRKRESILVVGGMVSDGNAAGDGSPVIAFHATASLCCSASASASA